MKNTNKSIFENYPDVVTVEQLASMLGAPKQPISL